MSTAEHLGARRTAVGELKTALRSAWVRFKEHLDTERGRGLLGVVLSVVLTARYREPCRVRWDGAHWVYRWRDGIAFGDAPHIQRVRPVEIGSCDFWDYLPKRGDVALVVGAGLGHETSTLARLVGPTGRVYAFEANPRTFADLERLCELNGWTNVEPVHAAISNESGEVTISNDDDRASNDIFRGEDEGTVVEAFSLDDFARARHLEHIDFMTMNIEGAERLAVDGMSAIAPSIDHLCISCHDFLGVEEKATKAYVLARLRAQGFAVRERSDDPHPIIRDFVYGRREQQGPDTVATREQVP